MKSFLILIKGFFIGVAEIIPGVSGGTIALLFGIYEHLINVISKFNISFSRFISESARIFSSTGEFGIFFPEKTALSANGFSSTLLVLPLT